MKAEKGSLSWPQQRSVERGGKPCEWEVTDGAINGDAGGEGGGRGMILKYFLSLVGKPI